MLSRTLKSIRTTRSLHFCRFASSSSTSDSDEAAKAASFQEALALLKKINAEKKESSRENLDNKPAKSHTPAFSKRPANNAQNRMRAGKRDSLNRHAETDEEEKDDFLLDPENEYIDGQNTSSDDMSKVMSPEHISALERSGLYRVSRNGTLMAIVSDDNVPRFEEDTKYMTKAKNLVEDYEKAVARGDKARADKVIEILSEMEDNRHGSREVPSEFERLERERLGDPNAVVEYEHDIPQYRKPRPDAFNPAQRLDLRDPRQFFTSVREVLGDSAVASTLADYEYEDLPSEAVHELNLLADELLKWDSDIHPSTVMKESSMEVAPLDYQIPDVEARRDLQNALDREAYIDPVNEAVSMYPGEQLKRSYLKFRERRMENVDHNPPKIHRTLESALEEANEQLEAEELESMEKYVQKMRAQEEFSTVMEGEDDEAARAKSIDRLADAMARLILMTNEREAKGVDVSSDDAFRSGRAADGFVFPETRSESDMELIEQKARIYAGETLHGEHDEGDVQVDSEENVYAETDESYADLPEELRLIRTSSEVDLRTSAPFLVENNPRDTVIDEPWEVLRKRLLSRKGCPLCIGGRCKPLVPIDYTNIRLLNEFINDAGALVPKRMTGLCAKRQREISKCLKVSRRMGLMPYTAKWDFRPFNAVREIMRVDQGKEYTAESAIQWSSDLESVDQDAGNDLQTMQQLDDLETLDKQHNRSRSKQ